MKTKVIFTITAMFVLGLAVAVYALNTSGPAGNASIASCCCCSGDSCPMKDKDAAVKTGDAVHNGCDCCGDAESCPMKKGDAAAAKTEGHADCCPADSCPMMKKGDVSAMADGAAKTEAMASCPMMNKTDASATAGMTAMDDKHKAHMAGAAGCDCSCCHKNKEKKDAPAV